MRENRIYKKAYQQLGEKCNVSTDLFGKMQEFVNHMYAFSTTICDVNDVCYTLLYGKRGDVESTQLPPCKDCLYMHVLRANYQVAIWRHCLERRLVALDPKTCGWKMDDEGNRIIE
jgi:hypothetical protein